MDAPSYRGCGCSTRTWTFIGIRRWGGHASTCAVQTLAPTEIFDPTMFCPLLDLRFRVSDFFRITDFGFRVLAIVLCCVGCSSTRQSRPNANLLPPLRPYVNGVASELEKVSAERRVVLDEIAATIAARLQAGKTAQ